jgi:hypothetical protein
MSWPPRADLALVLRLNRISRILVVAIKARPKGKRTLRDLVASTVPKRPFRTSLN